MTLADRKRNARRTAIGDAIARSVEAEHALFAALGLARGAQRARLREQRKKIGEARSVLSGELDEMDAEDGGAF